MTVSNMRGYGLAALSSIAVAYYALLNQSWFGLGALRYAWWLAWYMPPSIRALLVQSLTMC